MSTLALSVITIILAVGGGAIAALIIRVIESDAPNVRER